MYTQYVFPFELAAVVLLVAIVAAIALTLAARPASAFSLDAPLVVTLGTDRLPAVVSVATV